MPTQRRRRAAQEEGSEDEDSRPRQRQNREESAEAAESSDASDGGARNNSADDQLAKKLVRYALSCEYSRTPIRRDGIKERVLGEQGRSFRRIFELAQKQLRTIWGMELRELPVREKMTLHEKRQAMRANTQPKTGSGAYILTSTLPEAYRAATIIKPSNTPTSTIEAMYLAFYTTVVSLIWLNAGELSEQKLSRYLTRLNANRNLGNEKTEFVLKKMERQGYVVKKVDRPPLGHDGEDQVTWHIGPRAKEEIGLDGVMGFVREVYGDSDPDLESKLRASLGVKQQPKPTEEQAEDQAMQTAQD